MPPARATLRSALKSFDFATIFNQLGWDNHITADLHIAVDSSDYRLSPVAQKRGMVIYLYESPDDNELPSYAARRKIENQVRRSAHEHLVIYASRQEGRQVWQWVRREPGTPTACREHSYSTSQQGDALIEKLERIAFSLAEEDSLNIIMVAGRARDAFDVERVTKRFYDRFKREHDSFLRFIEGIKAQGDREWYASLMLNRLMFVYFIQKKGFLDGDSDYLRRRLVMMQATRGKNQFLSFYRHFALRLFHEGLGAGHHDAELDALLGKVPYINGGLFDVHKLERDNPDIEIPDEAFEKIFDFFDAYQWHLDERPLRNDNEINPDVLGYIFEKYINQKQMGAYYTKEDITEYIAKNTVIPRVLEAAREQCEVAFKAGSASWRLLQSDPDRYIYDDVIQGIEEPLPADVLKGLKNVAARESWNRVAPTKAGLPTETWREVVSRRERVRELRAELAAGRLGEPDRLVALNVNLRQFCQDLIENSEGPELVRAMYQAISEVSILDPMCGSGAFLFAALNVLEPLYEACLDRMQSFVDELNVSAGRRGDHFADFRALLERVAQHPNRRYFVLKSIILNNLYGVDIMEEAVEICKLRLFLKLVAQVDSAAVIEPLPDIDFNIRAGNSLVGFVDYASVQAAVLGTAQKRLDLGGDMDLIDRRGRLAEEAFTSFREMQTHRTLTSEVLSHAKHHLTDRLDDLRKELDRYLSSEYGIPTDKLKRQEAWKASFRPFHWWVEFYGIVKVGGFDVVIGNPPYVEYGAEVQRQYTVRGYRTLPCGNLHAFCAERCLALVSVRGRVGLIVPLPSINTERMTTLQEIIKPPTVGAGRSLWVSAFDERPSNLFVGVDQRLVIELIGPRTDSPQLFTTGIMRWASETRPWLFASIPYTLQPKSIMTRTASICKVRDAKLEVDMLEKLYTNKPIAKYRSMQRTSELVAYRTAGGRYWKVALDTPFPADTLSGKTSYLNGLTGRQAAALIGSSTFWWYYSVHFDMYNLKDYMIWAFPFSDPKKAIATRLDALGGDLIRSLETNAVIKTIQSKTRGAVEQKTYVARKSKPVIDRIDSLLASHYGFTDAERDFVCNYDIRFRLGADEARADEA
jgi:hypothetical protein